MADHSKRTKPAASPDDRGEDQLFDSLSRCIAAANVEPETGLITTLSLAVHAAFISGFSREQFLKTAALAYDAGEQRWGGN